MLIAHLKSRVGTLIPDPSRRPGMLMSVGTGMSGTAPVRCAGHARPGASRHPRRAERERSSHSPALCAGRTRNGVQKLRFGTATHSPKILKRR